jgi:glycosyltransferase involved in cell wall biosynthesis
MKVSTVIATYNSAATIAATLESVLQQTVAPDEIVVLDDGSTDDTRSILRSYASRIRVIAGKHEGVAAARNALCKSASGDLIAFLDSDDIWHPTYLERQIGLFAKYPDAVAFFTGHVDFRGKGKYEWEHPLPEGPAADELMDSVLFFKRYNTSTGTFGSMSYCCVPQSVIQSMDGEPFQTNGADDFYFLNWALLSGPVVYDARPLVAYRIAEGSISSDRVVNYGERVRAFELLQERYAESSHPGLIAEFKKAFASHRRLFSKYLMGAGETAKARTQLKCALLTSGSISAIAKSTMMFSLTYMPSAFQPKWPARYRQT